MKTLMPLMMLMMPLKTWGGMMQLLRKMSLKKIAWRRGGLKKTMPLERIGLKKTMLM
jgi:hypothetical protein